MLGDVLSARALHRATQAAMNASFDLEWLARAPFRELHPRLRSALEQLDRWPAPESYDELVRLVPQGPGVELPRFVTQSRDQLTRVGGYEQHVARLRSVPTRPSNWHDFFNMVVWAHFPKLRWALNALHVDPDVGPKDPRNGRAPAQNLAATFDESGLLVVSTSEELLADLRELRFKRFFWERRAELGKTTRFWHVGHGTLESLLAAHPGLAAKALLLHVPALPTAPEGWDTLRFQLDERAADQVSQWRTTRAVLDPVPVLGIPGYCDNEAAEFYDDAQHFRFERRSRRPGAPTT
ncbi:MAG: DUF3025 domain-containing protein [Myxococcales bacterium]|nr:MAG: DUF3025 domain-containing protein [Myxococcales bacterium]